MDILGQQQRCSKVVPPSVPHGKTMENVNLKAREGRIHVKKHQVWKCMCQNGYFHKWWYPESSSNFIGFSLVNHPAIKGYPLCGNPQMAMSGHIEKGCELPDFAAPKSRESQEE